MALRKNTPAQGLPFDRAPPQDAAGAIGLGEPGRQLLVRHRHRPMIDDTAVSRGLWHDAPVRLLSLAIRRLRQQPSFTAAAIGVLAAGIAAPTALFALVNATLLRPLPYAHAEDIYTVRTTMTDGRYTIGRVASAELNALRQTTDADRRARGPAAAGAARGGPRSGAGVQGMSDPAAETSLNRHLPLMRRAATAASRTGYDTCPPCIDGL